MPAPLDHRSPAFFDYAVQADGVAYKFRIADYFHSGPLSDSETEARRLSVLASCARLAAEAGTP
ncbi:MAG TPA: hypothetical protein VGI05_19675 [Streptosporangiaceae bacterium]